MTAFLLNSSPSQSFNHKNTHKIGRESNLELELLLEKGKRSVVGDNPLFFMKPESFLG